VLSDLSQEPVRSVARRQPIVVAGDLPIHAVLQQMTDDRQGAVLIADEQGVLCGIFTERDVLMKLGADEGLRDRPVARLMTPDPNKVQASEPLGTALHRMREGGFRHLPIVDQAGKPVGILSIRDVLVVVADHFPKEILNLPPVPRRGASPLDGG
jgi:CBS domain-containing protein